MIPNPCYKCQDRIVPSKENPHSCHGNCEREAIFKRQEAEKAAAKFNFEREEREVKKVWDGKTKRVCRSRAS